jgi:hypothetical protein
VKRNEHLDEIRDAADEYTRATYALWQAVESARSHRPEVERNFGLEWWSDWPVTWEDIGLALGVTRQAAQRRFSKAPPGRLL